MAISIIDSSTSLIHFIDALEKQPTDPPSFYLDIEGIQLSRHGSISIIQLFHRPRNQVFLIDIFILQKAAFNTPNKSGTTFRSILQSPLVPKVFFDVRNDADALYAHFDIALQGVHDVQLLEVATRSSAKDRLNGLAGCLKRDTRLTAEAKREWEATKERGRALFAVEQGGSYEVFNTRPLAQDIVDYCAQDVVQLPLLWNTYMRKITTMWLRRAKEETVKRVLMSRAESYEPTGPHKVVSPWARPSKMGNRNRLEDFQAMKEEKQKARAAKEAEGEELPGASEPRKVGRPAIVDTVRREGQNIPPAIVNTVRREGQNVPPAIVNTVRREGQNIPKVTAAKAAHRKAEQQLSGDLISRFCALAIEPHQASKPMAETIAVQEAPPIADLTHNRPLPLFPLPLGSKPPTYNKTVANVDPTPSRVSPDSFWRCSTCNRMMLATQKQDHLTGKAHRACLKQVPNTLPNATTLQTPTPKKESLQTAATKTTEPSKTKAKAGIKIQQKTGKKVKSNGTKRKRGAAISHTYQQPVEAHSSDWGFIGFQQVRCTSHSGYDGFYTDKGSDFGACDKDCGWCGHCMDNVDF